MQLFSSLPSEMSQVIPIGLCFGFVAERDARELQGSDKGEEEWVGGGGRKVKVTEGEELHTNLGFVSARTGEERLTERRQAGGSLQYMTW